MRTPTQAPSITESDLNVRVLFISSVVSVVLIASVSIFFFWQAYAAGLVDDAELAKELSFSS